MSGTPPAFILSQDQTLRIGLFDSSISLDYCFTCFKSFDLNPNLFLVLESLYHSLIVNVLLSLTSKPVDHTRLPYFVNPFIS